MKNCYILQVVDYDDGYIYDNLIYDNLEDYEKAKKIIDDCDKYWYSENFEENEETNGGFYEYLYIKLSQNNLYNDIEINKIYVR